MTVKKPKLKKTKISKLTHNTVPATVGLVKKVRNELQADIRSVDHKIEAVDHKVDSLNYKLEALNHKVDALSHKIESVDHSLQNEIRATENRLESKIEKVMVSVHRTQVLMEEQRGDNRIVLDGIKALIERQDRFETDLFTLQNSVNTLGRSAKS